MTPPYGATPENRMFHLGIVYTTTSQENQTIPVPVTVPQLHALVVEEIDKATDESAPIVDVVNKAIDNLGLKKYLDLIIEDPEFIEKDKVKQMADYGKD